MLVADLLCGAGGSSTGCTRALHELGLVMELVSVNHWPLAIDRHALMAVEGAAGEAWR
jgi:DNA (cytosine-5)-methyltransferase 1